MRSYHMKAFSPILLITAFFNSSNMRVLSFVARSSLLAPQASNHLATMLHAAGTSEAEPRPPPKIIQGGMGVRISSWQLAREVSKRDGLGVVSGTAMDVVFVRTLQDGDEGGHFRRALATFPNQLMVEKALDKYFIPGGKPADKPYRSLPLWALEPSRQTEEATILGNYCEVWLAKHNDDGTPTGGLVGINLLTKVSLPTIHSLYGAMLAEVDYVIMGAGIPSKIPGILDSLAEGNDCTLPIEVSGATAGEESHAVKFSPKTFWKGSGSPHLAEKPLNRPDFLPIVSSTTLAQSLLKRSNGRGPTRGIDGFVVELHTAGGHNAPPRGWHFEAKDTEEPAYGEKDMVDVKSFAKVAKGLPFWFAGSYGKREKLREVLEGGGNGVQVGTLFALAQESGMDPAIKQSILTELVTNHKLHVYTDPAASPTGFPFKVLEFEGNNVSTLSDPKVYDARPRVCNLGYLRSPYLKPNGEVGYRCPAEPVNDYVAKGGDADATVGRKCLCNALCADAGFPQVRFFTNPETGNKDIYVEPGLITTGDDINECKHLIKQSEHGTWAYTASDAMDYLLSGLEINGEQKRKTFEPVRV
ncbi:hypothetical protein ACHAW6_003062 [Cyclotella cf. meneghiniana]